MRPLSAKLSGSLWGALTFVLGAANGMTQARRSVNAPAASPTASRVRIAARGEALV